MSIADWVSKTIICMGECKKKLDYSKFDIMDLAKDFEETNGTLVCSRCKPTFKGPIKRIIAWKCRKCSTEMGLAAFYSIKARRREKTKCAICDYAIASYQAVFEEVKKDD